MIPRVGGRGSRHRRRETRLDAANQGAWGEERPVKSAVTIPGKRGHDPGICSAIDGT
jgi:hypothetical protein